MDANDAPSSVHSHVDAQSPIQATFHVNSSNQKAPRLQKKQPPPPYPVNSQQSFTLPQNRSTRPLGLNDRERRTQEARLTLENLGSHYPRGTYNNAVMLENMLQSGTAQVAGTWDYLYGTRPLLLQDPTIQAGRTFEVDSGNALDWQSALATPQFLRSPSAEKGPKIKVTKLLKPSAPAFVPNSQTVQLPWPRIFVEPRSAQPHEVKQSRRTPAMETIPRVRQQQIQQSALPTPPSSSSPQWSSKFSPYPTSLYSPDLTTSNQNWVLGNMARQNQRSSAESSNKLRRFVYERINGGAPPKVNISSPDLQVNQTTSSSPAVDVSRVTQLSSPLSPYPTSSPRHPGPPPTTPLPPLPSVPDSAFRLRQTLISTTPPSPTSPVRKRPRSISYQHPRSVPLSRTIQRRLASVPEEDLSSFLERNRSMSPPQRLEQPPTVLRPQDMYFAKTLTSRQVTSPPQHQNQSLLLTGRTPSPVFASLGLRSKAEDEYELMTAESGPRNVLGSKSGLSPVKVRLPPTSLRPGLRVEYTRDEQSEDRGARLSDERKENSMKRAGASKGTNSRKKGGGKKSKTSSTGIEARTDGGAKV